MKLSTRQIQSIVKKVVAKINKPEESIRVTIRVSCDLLNQLDSYRLQEEQPLTRTEFIRKILKDYVHNQ